MTIPVQLDRLYASTPKYASDVLLGAVQHLCDLDARMPQTIQFDDPQTQVTLGLRPGAF
jgi:hypothetical protein